LRGTNLTFVKALLWPILGVPHERTTVKGLRLRATPDGAQILLDRRTSTVWEVEQRAATIKELCEIDPDLQAVEWPFGSTLSRQIEYGREKVTLIRDARQGF